jgi:hypothetical protein
LGDNYITNVAKSFAMATYDQVKNLALLFFTLSLAKLR